MRWGLAALVVTFAVIVARMPPGAAAQCVPTLVYLGQYYSGTEQPRDLPATTALTRSGFYPACNDVVTDPPLDERDTNARVFRIHGVRPEVAVTADDGSLYLAFGFLPDLASHPLHQVIYADRHRARRLAGPHCRVAGRVIGPGGLGPLMVHADHVTEPVERSSAYPVIVYLRPRTAVRGLSRLGLPYVREGDYVHVSAALCKRHAVTAESIAGRRGKHRFVPPAPHF